MDQRPSGWYDDPDNPELLRYWDGVVWTEHTAWRRPQRPEPGGVQDRLSGDTEPSEPPTEGRFVSGIARGPAQHEQRTGTGYPGGQPVNRSVNMEDSRLANGAWQGMGRIAADGRPMASWGRRVLAYVIDALVMAFIALPFAYPVMSDNLPAIEAWSNSVVAAGPSATDAPLIPPEVAGTLATVGFITAVVRFAYEIITVRQWGGGVGKLLLGIRVRAYGGKGRLDWLGSIRRAIFKNLYSLLGGIPVLSYMALGYTFASYLWPLWDAQRQALHDKFARTELVRVAPGDRDW